MPRRPWTCQANIISLVLNNVPVTKGNYYYYYYTTPRLRQNIS